MVITSCTALHPDCCPTSLYTHLQDGAVLAPVHHGAAGVTVNQQGESEVAAANSTSDLLPASGNSSKTTCQNPVTVPHNLMKASLKLMMAKRHH